MTSGCDKESAQNYLITCANVRKLFILTCAFAFFNILRMEQSVLIQMSDEPTKFYTTFKQIYHLTTDPVTKVFKANSSIFLKPSIYVP